MSFWKTLLGTVAPIVAAPFTGGASLAGLGLGGALKAAAPALIGGVASGLAGGMQKGREAENAANFNAAEFAQRENAMKEAAGMNRAQMDLARRGFSQQSQGDAYQKALKSALALNLKDASINLPSRIPKFNISGGLRPSAIGAEGQAAAGELNKQAMTKLMGGEQFDALPAYQGTAAPEYRKPGFLENLTGTIGLGAGAVNSALGAAEDRNNFQQYIDAIQKLSQQRQQQQPMTEVPDPGDY